jgi:hypothetical protein
MKRHIFSVLLATVLLALASVTVPAQFETDFQVWNDTQFIVPLNKKKDLNAIVWAFGRFGDELRTTTDARISVLLSKRFNKYVTLSGGPLYRYANPTFNRRRYEMRYLGIATFTVPLSKDKKWTLISRNMYQYEDRYQRPNATILRTRNWLKREITLGSKTKIEPFVAYEPFYDFRLGGIARHRYQAGFTRKFNERFAGDFFFVHQDETGGGSRPGSLNGVGTSFRVNF